MTRHFPLLGASAIAVALACVPIAARAGQDGDAVDAAVARVRRHVHDLRAQRGAWLTPRLMPAAFVVPPGPGARMRATPVADPAGDPASASADGPLTDAPAGPTLQEEVQASPASAPSAAPAAANLQAQDQLPVHDVPAAAPPQQEAQVPPPPDNTSTAAAAIAPEVPGILTRRGVLVVEPSLQYQHTNINNFVAGGIAILDTVLVGSVQASQANRDAYTAAIDFRYGLTSRLEVETKIPGVYRADSTLNTLVSTNTPQSTTDLHDYGLGDIEAAAHYQVNDGSGTWPIFVANLRVKSNSGKGPFDVARDAAGVETELATGSGFWGIEPSVTVVAPSDPAVFYANLGYLYNISDSVDQTIGGRYLGRVDPGGAVRIGMGMGIALNEKVAFSLGYQHDFIQASTFHFSDGKFKTSALSVGTLNIGVNWQMTPDTALNINVAIGATNDAPDVALTARLPISFKLVD